MFAKSKTWMPFLLGLVIVTVLMTLVNSCRKDSKSQPVTLRIWQTETDPEAKKQLEKIVEDFKKAHKGEVEIDLESVAWSSLSSKLTNAINADNQPDIAHIEPFMAASLVSRDKLIPLDEVIDQITQENNDKIFESVLNLQEFDGKRYGIAYAVGTTGFAYRKDIADKLKLSQPKKWDEYVEFVKKMSQENDGKLKLLLPGGDPFFIDQLFAELVANNGGTLFNPETNRPKLDSKEVIETLEFFRQLKPYVDSSWKDQKYLDQFNRLARGETGNVPVTYARASRSIEAVEKDGAMPKDIKASPDFFAWMPQVTGPSYNGEPIATIDCEPYVIFKKNSGNAETDSQREKLAKEFLTLYFKSDNYINFVNKVPIHLTPIFKNMALNAPYTSNELISRWKPWEQQTIQFLENPNRVRPILMPDNSITGRKIPFLLEFQARNILTKAVSAVVSEDVAPEIAAKRAQEESEIMIENLGFRKW